MASTFVIADILTDAARTANVPDFTADTNITTTQATMWIVQGARSFSARVRQVFGENHDFLRETALVTQAGFNTLSLPADAGEVHQVLWAKTASDYRLLSYATADHLVDAQDGDLASWASRCAPTYRLEGETITFYPASSEAETVIIFYTSHLKLGGQTYFSSRLDADRWLALDVAVRILQAKGRDPSVLLQDKLLLEAQVFNPARNRTPNRVVTIRDSRAAQEAAARHDRWRF